MTKEIELLLAKGEYDEATRRTELLSEEERNVGLSLIAEKRGRYEEAYEAALASPEELGGTHIRRAYAAWRLGRHAEALTHAERAAVFPEVRARALNIRALILWSKGREEEDRALLQEALHNLQTAMREEKVSDLERSIIHNNLGNVLLSLGEENESLRHYKIALTLRERRGLKALVATTQRDIGRLMFRVGRYEESVQWHRKALELRRKMGNQVDTAKSLMSMGETLLAIGEVTEAKEYLLEARSLFQEIGQDKVVTSIDDLLEEDSKR